LRERSFVDGVLITRPSGAASETAQRVAAMGLRPILAPMLEIAPIRARRPEPRRLQAVLITSANALPALPSAYHTLPLLAVGDATAAHARAAGFRDVHSAAGDVHALASLVLARCDPAGAPLLLASGKDRSADPTPALQARGFTLIRRSVYTAVPADALPEAARTALSDGAVRAALFFSPATARAFVRLLPAALPPEYVSRVDALAISRATEQALAPLPWRRIRVASRPNQDELLALLQ
jgi:uroporphyrinogen-III synthase